MSDLSATVGAPEPILPMMPVCAIGKSYGIPSLSSSPLWALEYFSLCNFQQSSSSEQAFPYLTYWLVSVSWNPSSGIWWRSLHKRITDWVYSCKSSSNLNTLQGTLVPSQPYQPLLDILCSLQ